MLLIKDCYCPLDCWLQVASLVFSILSTPHFSSAFSVSIFYYSLLIIFRLWLFCTMFLFLDVYNLKRKYEAISVDVFVGDDICGGFGAVECANSKISG